ncbi:MAG: ATP-binding protein [Phycisphaerales bacterium]
MPGSPAGTHDLRPWRFFESGTPRTSAALHLCFVFAYATAQWLGYQLKYGPNGFSIMWPGLGILCGCLAVSPPRRWLGLLLLAALVEALITRWLGGGGGSITAWKENAVFVGSNLVTAVCFAVSVRWLVRRGDPLHSLPIFGLYLVICVGLTSVIAAAITTPLLGQYTGGYATFEGFRTFWISDAMGTLAVATPILIVAGGGRVPPRIARRVEAAILIGVAAVTTVTISWVQFGPRDLDGFAELIYLPMLAWALVRFGAAMLTVVALVMAVGMVSAMSMELGPFVVPGRPAIESVAAAQAFMLPSLIGILIVGAMFEQGRHRDERVREAEQHLRQLETVDAIGTMASGVAHDFGNLAMAVQTAQTTLRAHLREAPDSVRESVEQLGRSATKAQSLSQSLMIISREDDAGHVELIDVIESVEQAREALAPMLERTRRFAVRMPTGPIPVLGRQGDIARMVSSLVINARDATDERGRIAITVERRERSVRLTVTDDGRGIPIEAQERIFDPFYTTKLAGRGTGLGLSAVAGVVKDMNGQLSVASRDGQGTSITIDLPVAEVRSRDG